MSGFYVCIWIQQGQPTLDICLSLRSPEVTLCSNRLNFHNFYVLRTHCTCMFCVDLRTNTKQYPVKIDCLKSRWSVFIERHDLNLSIQFRWILVCKGKGKAVPLQVWSGSEGSRKFRCPDFTTMAQDSGKVVSLTHRPPLPPGNTPGTHSCQRLSRSQGHSAIGRILCQWKIHWHQLGSSQRPSDL